MRTWLAALMLAGVVAMLVVPMLRSWAFTTGWFERSTETRRSRAGRRPTHGGLVIGGMTLMAGALGGLDEKALWAATAATGIAVVTAHRAERGKGPAWLVGAGRLAAAAAVPALGIRAELTGTTAVDVVLTAIAVLVVIVGLDSMAQSDGVAPAVVAVAALGLLAVAVRADDPVAPLLAGLVGASVGVLAHAWPPAAVRVGRIGPTVAGTALAAAAIELTPQTSAPRSALVPICALVLLAAAALVPGLDRRLRRRGLPPHLVLPGVAGCGAYAADALSRGALEPGPAGVVALTPALVVALVGLVTHPATVPPSEPGERRRHRRSVVAATAVLLVLLAGLGTAAALAVRSARTDMEIGRDAAIEGLDAAREGDLAAAQVAFRVAEARLSDASEQLAQPLLRIGDLIPGVAQNLRGARALADVGSDLTGTAVAVAHRAGADDLRFVDGRFPVDAAADVGKQLGSALHTLGEASDRLGAIASPFLHATLREGSSAIAQRVASARASIEVAAEAARIAPSLLGAGGERRWLMAIMTPSELRGAGGLIGDFAELRTTEGAIELVRTIPARELNAATDPTEQAGVLPAVYREVYGGFLPERLWQNLSVTPDAETMSSAIAAAYPLLEGDGPVDGVIALDPLGVAALLELTGPIHVPTWPVPITAENAVQVLLFEHYEALVGPTREGFQAAVVGALIESLAQDDLPRPSTVAGTLSGAVAGGHLRLWSGDDEAQRLFQRLGLDGAMRAPGDGDFVQLVTQNGSESKIDWYLRRSLRYAAALDPASGFLDVAATVSLTNGAPASGVSDYIIGETGGPTRPGVSRLFSTIYTPHRPTSVTDENGKPLPVALARENGLHAITVLVELEPGATATVVYRMSGVVPPGTAYRLQVGHQPTIRPDHVELAVTTGRAWEVVSPPGGLAQDGRDAPVRFDVVLRGR